MALSPITSDLDAIKGEFIHRETKRRFEWKDAPENFAGMPHFVYVGSMGEMRFARVLKTVAHIVVDEDENGDPVIESWPIREMWRKG